MQPMTPIGMKHVHGDSYNHVVVGTYNSVDRCLLTTPAVMDSDSDEMISQALDMSELTRETLLNEQGHDSDALRLSLTQDKYLPVTEPVSEPFEGEYEHLLKPFQTFQLVAVDIAVDITDMLDDAGPCQIATSRSVKSSAANDTKIGTSKHFQDVSTKLLVTRKKPDIPENTLRKNIWIVNVFKKWRDEFTSDASNRRTHGFIFDLLKDTTKNITWIYRMRK